MFELSQQKLAEAAGISLRSIRVAEREDGAGEEVNSKLRYYYESQGVVFLGSIEIGSGVISACGVRWWDPEIDTASDVMVSKAHSDEQGIAFAAARAFLDLSMEEVSFGCGLNRRTIVVLESGKETASTENYKKLVHHFEEQGIEFLGRRDRATREFYGVGVRLLDGADGPV